MYTINHLCKTFHLSRSTLLYYDTIGLLKPSCRTESNYRKYSEEDCNRLRKICTFRDAGIPLEQMKEILNADNQKECEVLTEKLQLINKEIKELRFRQKLIVTLLKQKNQPDARMVLDKDIFATVLTSMGFDEKNLEEFHKRFEQEAPNSHQFFLELLGMDEEEIKNLKDYLLSQTIAERSEVNHIKPINHITQKPT